MRITPTWFGEQFVQGGGDIDVAIHLPKSVKPDEALHQGVEFSQKVLTDDGGVKLESWGLLAPEYNDELVVASWIENDAIAVYRDQLPPSEEGEFYWMDLEGLAVELADGQPPRARKLYARAESLAGPAVSLGELAGKPAIINFWATWCPPCKEEMPALEAAYNQHGGHVNFLAVNVEEDRPLVVLTSSFGEGLRREQSTRVQLEAIHVDIATFRAV